MKEEKIIITIDATNLTTYVEAEGFSGNACLEATAPFEGALGKVGKRKFKPAYNQPLKRSANKSVRNRRG